MSFSVSRCAFGLGVGLALAACRPSELPLTPAYAPTSKINFGVVRNTGANLAILLADQRSNKSAVGRNTEGASPVTVLATSDDVMAFVGDALRRELTAASYSIVTSGSVTLYVALLDLWVEESNTYNGSARIKVDVVKNGGVVTSLTVTGAAKRWGTSLSPENYNEILSDALLNAIQDLVKSNDFQTAIALDAAPAPAPAPAPAAPAAAAAP